MSRIWKLAVGGVAIVLLASCGKGKEYQYPSSGVQGYQGPLGITFESSVPPDQRALLDGDLRALSDIDIPDKNKFREIIGVSDLSAASLSQWLAKRVRVVVGERFDWQRNASMGASQRYNPTLLASTTNPDVVTVMFNVGAYLYLDGRDASRIYGLSIGGTVLPIKSPRVGVIQIGKGLFSSANSIKSSAPDSLANRYLRLAVFFHEARHADGNGVNAAFPHAKCTNELQGKYNDEYACETNLNGPYAVEAAMLSQFYTACRGCTAKELEGLRAFVADNIGRLKTGATSKDDRAEGIQ